MTISRRLFLALSSLPLVGAAARAMRIAQVEGAPGPGAASAARSGRIAGAPRRFGMTIDLGACALRAGCTACIDACHRTHNVPVIGVAGREVKWIWTEPFERAFGHELAGPANEHLRERPTLVFCNHCDNPPCVRVCPVQATWKRDDGIVAIDWHRCIGCRYCVAACPYGSRSFNWIDPRPSIAKIEPSYPTRTRGVVEKCTFCEERLAVGRGPACVEACTEGALVFGDLADEASAPRRRLRGRFSLRRKPELGTGPEVHYVV